MASRPPRLSRRIADAGLAPEVRRRFLDELRRVAAADGPVEEAEFSLIERLLPGADTIQAEPAELQSLWPHSELLLTACVFVAVADGEYGVEEARTISDLAHRLGLSAHQLGALEARVFGELQARADA
ncbi:MAG: hypothetical protein H6742_20175 [Alphaproteobacteria bacterium]|nr:hypothetical protein [Alphaproteobacteria bacterium]